MVHELVPDREIVRDAVLRAESFTTAGFVHLKLFQGCRFVESDFFAIRFEQCEFVGCVFERVDMSGSVFSRCTFLNCSLARSNFNHSTFGSCCFGAAGDAPIAISSCNFTQAEFSGELLDKNVMNARFEHCSLDFAKFRAFTAFDIELVDCNLQEALIAKCRSRRIDVRTCSCRGLRLIDNEFSSFLSYKEKFVRTIGVASLVGASDLAIDGDALQLKKQSASQEAAAAADMIRTLRDEASSAGRIFEQINSEIILRSIQDRYAISAKAQGSIVATAVEMQLSSRLAGIHMQLGDVTLAILALEAANLLTADDIDLLSQVGIAIISQHQPNDIELGKHIIVLNRVASKYKVSQYRILVTHKHSDDFTIPINFASALSEAIPDGGIVLEELGRGSIKSVLSANSKGFVIAILILLKLGISVKYTDDGSFHFSLSFDGNLIITDGRARLQYDQHHKDINEKDIERRTKKLRASGVLQGDLGQLEVQAGELTAMSLQSVRSFVNLAMPRTDFSRDFRPAISGPSAPSGLPQSSP
jgi:uncharacterized protein YjbI with pentapeptide repeats